MNPQPDRRNHHRRSIRLPGYDYSQAGTYFITLVTNQRRKLFGEIDQDMMQLNAIGKIVNNEWLRLEKRFPNLLLDEFVIMPNHLHGLLVIGEMPRLSTDHRAILTVDPKLSFSSAQFVTSGSLGAIVCAFKSSVTYRYNLTRYTDGLPLWQRNYYEHIVRNDVEIGRMRNYIKNNPVQWSTVNENPINV